jgi:hypothetical protein
MAGTGTALALRAGIGPVLASSGGAGWRLCKRDTAEDTMEEPPSDKTLA